MRGNIMNFGWDFEVGESGYHCSWCCKDKYFNLPFSTV